MISPQQLDRICALLIKCEDCGAQVFLGSDGLAKISNPSLLRADLLQSLRSEKASITEYLSLWQTDSPTDIPYVARNLDVIVWPRSWVGDSVFLNYGSKTYYRLTPDVYVWLKSAIEELLSKSSVYAATALPTLDLLGLWISRHYKPHEIAGGYTRRLGLPKCEPIELPDLQPGGSYQTWLESWKLDGC